MSPIETSHEYVEQQNLSFVQEISVNDQTFERVKKLIKPDTLKVETGYTQFALKDIDIVSPRGSPKN